MIALLPLLAQIRHCLQGSAFTLSSITQLRAEKFQATQVEVEVSRCSGGVPNGQRLKSLFLFILCWICMATMSDLFSYDGDFDEQAD